MSYAKPPRLTTGTFFVPIAAIILLHVIGVFLPGRFAWGFNFWGLFDNAPALLILTLAVLLVLPPVSSRVSGFLGRCSEWFPDFSKKRNRIVVGVLASAAALALMMLLRSRAHVYGDGFALLGAAGDENAPELFDQQFLQALSVYWHRWSVQGLSGLLGVSSEFAFSLTSSLGGLLGLWGIFAIARRLADDTPGRWAVMMAALSSGGVILFFGYIEHYTWATAAGLWSLCFAIDYVQTGRRLVWALLAAVIAAAFHLIAAPYLVVVAVAWFLHRAGDRSARKPNYALAMAATVALGLVAVVLMELSIGRGVFVWLWPRVTDPYWLLAPKHLIDVFNLVMLVAPLGLAAVVYRLWMRKEKGATSPSEIAVVGTAAFLLLLGAFLVDPELGAVRDWDLLSLFGFPLSILGGVWLVRMVDNSRGRASLAFAMAVLVLVQIVPNLAEKTRLEVATERLDNLLWEDPHYQTSNDDAARSLAWGFVLDSDVGETARAKRYFKRRLKAKKDSHQTWVNLGDIYYREGIYDSASVCFRNAVRLDYTEPHMLNKLANAEMQCGRKEAALKYIGMAAAALPDDVGIQTTYGVSLFSSGHHEQALAPLRRAYALRPDGIDQVFNLGLYFYSTGVADSAYHYFDRGLKMAPPSREHSVYYGMYIEAAINLGKRQEAARAIDTLERINPGAGDIGRFREMLAASR